MSKESRWAKESSFSIHWKTRSEAIAALIPEGSSVIEFGVGLFPISNFENLKPLSRYTATDFIEREELAFTYDLNSNPLADFEFHEIAVFSGVLEYIEDLPTKIKFISTRVNSIITSYCTVDKYPTERQNRDWVNSYSDTDFIEVFNSCDFELTSKDDWKNQTIYVFNRKKN